MNPLIILIIGALAAYILSDSKTIKDPDEENGASFSEESSSVPRRVLHRGQRTTGTGDNRSGVARRGVAGKTRKAPQGKQKAPPASTSNEEGSAASSGSSGEETAT